MLRNCIHCEERAENEPRLFVAKIWVILHVLAWPHHLGLRLLYELVVCSQRERCMHMLEFVVWLESQHIAKELLYTTGALLSPKSSSIKS
mmetsp:Transcript_33633/g.81820  ORF Transcript_33633/g.81820 Transcript_33633/m.81820 type:complete len:90 (-) Transcript_33633:10-279(-)